MIFDLIVVGAGPSGLSCAIHARKAGLRTVVLEKGGLVDSIRRFPTNLTWFSTPELLEIGNVPFVISTVRPSRLDTVIYYQKVASAFDLDIKYHDAVAGVSRRGEFFELTTQSETAYRSSYVIVATGYYDNPRWLGVPGEESPGVSHYYSEPHEFFDHDVLVVGGRNSAVEAALDLYRHGARVTLVHRGGRLSEGVKYWILPDIENRIKAGQIQALFSSRVKEIDNGFAVVHTPVGDRRLTADHVFVLIGFQPDAKLLRSWGIALDPETLAPKIDPATYETNIPGLYVAGSVVAGAKTNAIFVENGRLHGEVIVGAILKARQRNC